MNQVNNVTAVTQLSNLSLNVHFGKLNMKMVKYEDGMLILGQKLYIWWSRFFFFSSVISTIESMYF